MTTVTNWVLFSSAARPQYLENDVRCLALLPGMQLQFRYLEDIVSPAFKEAVRNGQIAGNTAYLTYLDNRDKQAKPTFVLLREAKIQSCDVRGTAYIIKLIMGRYVDHHNHTNLDAQVAGWALDRLPDWENDDYVGFWAQPIKQALPDAALVAHDFAGTRHLEAFEATVDKLATHGDFKNDARKLFLNVIDIRDRKKKSVVGSLLNAGQDYRILFYHYFREPDTHADWKPFWIKVWSNSKNLTINSEASLKLESEYDEIEITFSLDREMGAEKPAIELRLIPVREDDPSVLSIHFPFEVVPRVVGRWLRVGFMTVGLFAAQGSVLLATDKIKLDALTFWILSFLLLTSFGVAIASVFNNFKREP